MTLWAASDATVSCKSAPRREWREREAYRRLGAIGGRRETTHVKTAIAWPTLGTAVTWRCEDTDRGLERVLEEGVDNLNRLGGGQSWANEKRWRGREGR